MAQPKYIYNPYTGKKDAISDGVGAVDSVNGKSGDVVLTAGSVGADPAGTAAGGLVAHLAEYDHSAIGGSLSAGSVTYGGGTVEDALDQLLYAPMTITAFTLNGGGDQTLEKGRSLSVTELAYTLSKTASDTPTINGTPRTSPYNPAATLTSTTAYTLSATDGTTTATASRSASFLYRRWYGAGDAALIAALTAYTSGSFDGSNFAALTSALSESHTLAGNVHPAGGYPIFAVKGTAALSCTWAGTPVDLVQKTVTVVNSFGSSTDYRVAWIVDLQSNPITLSWS